MAVKEVKLLHKLDRARRGDLEVSTRGVGHGDWKHRPGKDVGASHSRQLPVVLTPSGWLSAVRSESEQAVSPGCREE